MAVVLGLVAALALGAAAAAAAARGMDADMAELAQAVRESCVAESGVSVALLARVDGGTSLAAVAEPTLKCYIKCTMETAGMLSEGSVDVEAVLALLPDAMRASNEAALRACGTRRGADLCDTAFLTQLCWQAANKADYFLI